MEKIVHDQIQGYLEVKKILNPRQAGYRQHNSTETALLRLTDNIRSNINNRKLTVLLLFDFSKAFQHDLAWQIIESDERNGIFKGRALLDLLLYQWEETEGYIEVGRRVRLAIYQLRCSSGLSTWTPSVLSVNQ